MACKPPAWQDPCQLWGTPTPRSFPKRHECTFDALAADWRERIASAPSRGPDRALDLFVENPYWTVNKLAEGLGIAFTTAQRAIDRLEVAGVVTLASAAKRNRVYSARDVLEILEERPRLAGSERARPRGEAGMSPEISESAVEEAIECRLIEYGPDACAGDATAVRETPPPYGESPPGGYRKRKPEDYERTLCLLPRDAVDFVLATQPKEWKKLAQHHGKDVVREQFWKRLAAEIERRRARRAAQRPQGLRDQAPARVVPPGERAQRRDASAPRGEPVLQ